MPTPEDEDPAWSAPKPVAGTDGYLWARTNQATGEVDLIKPRGEPPPEIPEPAKATSVAAQQAKVEGLKIDMRLLENEIAQMTRAAQQSGTGIPGAQVAPHEKKAAETAASEIPRKQAELAKKKAQLTAENAKLRELVGSQLDTAAAMAPEPPPDAAQQAPQSSSTSPGGKVWQYDPKSNQVKQIS